MSDGVSGGSPAEKDVSQELREEQVLNAVSFLKHPKVRASSETSKRDFLLRKGLTALEIDEAFRRVPEASSTAVALETLSKSDGDNSPPSESHSISSRQDGTREAHIQSAQRDSRLERSSSNWTQTAIGLGFAAAAAYAAKQVVWPFVSDRWSTWRGTRRGVQANAGTMVQDTLSIEDHRDRSATASDMAAVADAIRAQTGELSRTIEALQKIVDKLERGKDDVLTLEALREELKAVTIPVEAVANSGKGMWGTSPDRDGSRMTPGESDVFDVELELAEIKAMLSEYVKTPRSSEQGQAPPSRTHG